MHEREERNFLKTALELLAFVGPIICLIDCIVIPVTMAVLPLIGMHQIFHGISDQIQAIIVLCICAPVLLPGFLKHRKKRVLAFMGLGFALIFLANFAGHEIDYSLHALITIAGSVLLIKANFDNRRFNRCHSCCKQETVLVSIETQQ